ncbi:MAG TPA: hypothetical protein VKE69_05315 [Planctomycetota bacterium]|nr:hypothetical protein [Planctomycetota bacterium]
MSPLSVRLPALAVAIAAFVPSLPAQSLFASQVVSFNQGTGGGIFIQSNILGAPHGGGSGSGSLDVLTLGNAGSVTLGFDVVIRDGPGADFTAFENGFLVGAPLGGSVFAECAFVEVSSNGVDFARFPTSYKPSVAGTTPMGSLAGLCGGTPVFANPSTNSISPFDPVVSGGDAFDLADLAQDPLVIGGQVDLQAISFVRLVDVNAGVDLDSHGNPIPGGASADIDAVAVLHHTAEADGGPVCDLSVDAQGFIHWRLGDPDGLLDLDFATLASSLQTTPFDAFTLLSFFQLVSFDGSVAEAVSTFTTSSGIPVPMLLAVSVRDHAGNLAGDQVALQN